MTIQITIIGMGQIGASIGLALADHKDNLSRRGADRDRAKILHAQKIGAIDEAAGWPSHAARGADVVILAVPPDELRETLETITTDLRDGAIVVDTSPLSGAATEWASQLLPQGRHFVTMTPAINPDYLSETALGPEAIHPDLFNKGMMIITTAAGASTPAIKLAADLAEMLGAAPLFADPAEADGLLAACYILPQLVSAAMLIATLSQPGWREGRKIAGRSYAAVTSPIMNPDESRGIGHAAVLNRQNVLRVLNDLQSALLEMREKIEKGDPIAVEELLDQARAGRELWIKQRTKADWLAEEVIRPDAHPHGGILDKMFGTGIRSPRREPRQPS
jgi:prephenate dehydrogenase